MNLSDIVTGSTVFVDTNILLYARTGQSRQCQDFVKRCKEPGLQRRELIRLAARDAGQHDQSDDKHPLHKTCTSRYRGQVTR